MRKGRDIVTYQIKQGREIIAGMAALYMALGLYCPMHKIGESKPA